jgi:hypothetical protein
VGPGGGERGRECDGPNVNAANIRSIFRYEGAYVEEPYSVADVALPQGCYDEPGLVPYVVTQVPQELPEQITLGFTNTAVQPGLVQWLIDGSPMKVNLSRPTLGQIYDGNDQFVAQENVYRIGETHKVGHLTRTLTVESEANPPQFQYWVIQQGPDIPAALPHPIHLHGHDFFVLDAQGNATWTGNLSRLKFDNPPRRDTATLPARGYLVLAFESDNPGVWLMHCHIPFHVSAGFGLQFIERGADILNSTGELNTMREECKSWNAFEREFYPNGFELGDSLVRRM